MDLTELQDVQRTERQMDSLQHLSDTFYEDVAEYIAERKAERRRLAEATDDPFGDPSIGRLTDEIKTAEEVVKAIYERRIGKVVKLASFDAADMKTDTGGLTSEERALFDDLVEQIITNREHVLSVLGGEGTEDSAHTETPISEGGDTAQKNPDQSIPTESASSTESSDTEYSVSAASQSQNSDPNSEISAGVEDTANADSTSDSRAQDGSNADTETETERQRSDPVDNSTPPNPDDVLAAAMGDGGNIVDAVDTSPVNTDPDNSDNAQNDPVTDDDTAEPTPTQPQSTPQNPIKSDSDVETPSDTLNSASTTQTDSNSQSMPEPETVSHSHHTDSTNTPSSELGSTDINHNSDEISGMRTDESYNISEGETATEPGAELESDITPDTTSDDPDRVILRITADVGRILGVDQREYDLAAEDIIMLPETNAEPLLSQDAAERLD
jgi:Uncharacterized protein conserved in archaea